MQQELVTVKNVTCSSLMFTSAQLEGRFGGFRRQFHSKSRGRGGGGNAEGLLKGGRSALGKGLCLEQTYAQLDFRAAMWREGASSPNVTNIQRYKTLSGTEEPCPGLRD